MQWEDKEVLRVLGEIHKGGLSLHDVIRQGLSRAFFGPTDPWEIIEMLGLTEADDGTRGSGRYGTLWQLPLGHQRRAVLAERLAIVGDPRRGVGLDADKLPEIDWVAFAGGTIEIEGRTMTVAPFAMARYPVTIVQFRAFVAECFRGGVWQLPPGFTGRPPEKSPPEHKGRAANHGADSVSWYDAQAFCHWLSARLGMNVRLPTEAEWQLAATGGDPGCTWPWGADWNPKTEQWLANTRESDLGRTLPVGFYPLGASPAGVMDMVGNLWEWCSNAVDASRVLRGGSWYFDQDGARAADRGGFNPFYRSNYIGFRVVCSSPSSEP